MSVRSTSSESAAAPSAAAAAAGGGDTQRMQNMDFILDPIDSVSPGLVTQVKFGPTVAEDGSSLAPGTPPPNGVSLHMYPPGSEDLGDAVVLRYKVRAAGWALSALYQLVDVV